MNVAGPGVWAWDLSRLGDLAGLGARASVLGFRWVAMRGSIGGSTITPRVVDSWRAANVEPVYWWYSTPEHLDAQLAMVRDARAKLGIEAFAIDAEVEWETTQDSSGVRHLRDWRADAASFARRLRDAVGDGFLADAPYVLPSASHLFPFREFGAACDARMPQLYYGVAALDRKWTTPPTDADLLAEARKYLARADLEWAQLGGVVCPILSQMNARGSARAPLAALEEHWSRYASRPCWSLWSYEWLDAAEREYLSGVRFEPPETPITNPPAA